MTESIPNVPMREAAKQLGVSVATLRKWESRGYISAIRVPEDRGHRRFTQDEIDRVRQGRRVSS